MEATQAISSERIYEFTRHISVFSQYLGTDELEFNGRDVSYHMQDDIDRTEKLDIHFDDEPLASIRHEGDDEETFTKLILLAEEVNYDKQALKTRLKEMYIKR